MHAASIAGGRPGVLHGNRTYLLMDADGQINEAHSISAGLDYPGIGPEHAWLNDIGRVKFLSATDEEALAAFQLCSQARRHHSGARARARAGKGRGPRAAKAEGSPDGGQPVRPRRQGPRERGRVSRAAPRMNGLARAGASCGDQPAEDRRLDLDHRVGRLYRVFSSRCGCSHRARSSRKRNGCSSSARS